MARAGKLASVTSGSAATAHLRKLPRRGFAVLAEPDADCSPAQGSRNSGRPSGHSRDDQQQETTGGTGSDLKGRQAERRTLALPATPCRPASQHRPADRHRHRAQRRHQAMTRQQTGQDAAANPDDDGQQRQASFGPSSSAAHHPATRATAIPGTASSRSGIDRQAKPRRHPIRHCHDSRSPEQRSKMCF